MNLVSMVEEPPTYGSRQNIFVFSRVQGQMTRCVIRQTGAGAWSLRSSCTPIDMYSFETRVWRSNRAQHTSIEIREKLHNLCDTNSGGVCGSRGMLQGVRRRCYSPPFPRKDKDALEQRTTADPKAEQTTQDPTKGGSIRNWSVSLSSSCAGQILLRQEEERIFFESQSL